MEWISTKDRLPPVNSFVLGYGPRCQSTTIANDPSMMVFYFDDEWWDANDDFELFCGNVTHWMPLPRPPVE